MSIDILQSSTQSALLFILTLASDHISPATGLSPTVTLCKNGGAFGAPAGAVTEISNGWYKVAANATDTNTLGPLALHATVATADPCDFVVANIVSYNPQSATPAVNVTQMAGVAVIPRYTGTALSGSTSSIGLAANTSALQCGIGDLIVITGGTGAGQSGYVTSVAGAGGSTPVASMLQSWQSANPDGTSTYEIFKIGQLIPAQPSDVTTPIEALLPTALVNGRMSSDIGSVASIAVSTNGSGTQNIGGP